MKFILIDSDILIDFLKGNITVSDRLNSLKKEYELSISVITYMELLVGARDKKELKKLIDFLESFKRIEIDFAISENAIDLIKELGLSHGLKIPDALIASTALTKKLSLYTKNLKHFQPISELKLIK